MMPLPIDILENISLEEILSKMKERKPVLIKNWDIGSCIHTWTCEYVSNKVGTKPVKIHVSKDGKMDFINKNFVYKTLGFDELIKRIFCSHQNEYFIHPSEFYYLRSLGPDPRGKEVANFFKQYEELAQDFKLPPFFNEEDYFSSVFRASSKGLQLWTHYDIMDNILVQIRGMKRVILWPPSEVDKLYLAGDKSLVLNIDNPDVQKYPKFIKAKRLECLMHPGDILFIPALWFHNVISLTPSLGINIFWKNLPHKFYEKNDSYGNKDLIVGTKGLHAVESALKSLNTLPTEYKNFYIQRMIKLLQDSLEILDVEQQNSSIPR